MNDCLLRSLLFVPAHNDKLIMSAIRFDADAIVLDLEDSVQPKSMKQIARDNVVKYINQGIFKNHRVFVRINDFQSGESLRDLHQLTIPGIEAFLCSKVKTGKDVYFFDKLLESIEYEKGFTSGTFLIIPIIETTAAVMNVQDICQASPRVIAVAFGSEDFITDMHAIDDKEEQTLFTARNLIVMAARSNNIVPIDAAYVQVHDLEGLEKHLIISKKLGFGGISILSPKQLSLANQYFSPSFEEVAEAKEMLRMSEESEKQSKGVDIVNNKFVGPPLVERAKNILKKHQLIINKHKNE